MTNKFTLSPEHEALLPAHHKTWIANSMRVGPYTEEEIEALPAVVDHLYRVAGYAPPEYRVLSKGPVTAAYCAGMAAVVHWVKDASKDELKEAFGKKPTHPELSAAMYEVCLKARDQIGANLDEMVRVTTEACGLEPKSGNAPPKFVDFMKESANRGTNLHNGGNHWSGWSCAVSFLRDTVKLHETQPEMGEVFTKFIPYEGLAKYGPRFAHPRFCIVCEFPLILSVDTERRAHSATGPHQSWNDGVEFYFWRGVEVPKEWIVSPDTVDRRLALTHPNAEMRRSLTEILGWGKILEKMEKKVINQDPDPLIGTLFELDLGDDEGRPGRFLEITCGTGRKFVQRVAPTVTTALEGQAFFRRVDVSSWLKPEVRT